MSGVGKTTLIETFLNNKYTDPCMPTYSFKNYFCRYKSSDGILVNVDLYDTAGQENFHAISKSYYQKTDSCLLVYSISDRSSFDEIKNYYNPKIKEYCKKNI